MPPPSLVKWGVYLVKVYGEHPGVVVDIQGDQCLVVHGRTEEEPHGNHIQVRFGTALAKAMLLQGDTHFWFRVDAVHILKAPQLIRKWGTVPLSGRPEFEQLALTFMPNPPGPFGPNS